MIELEPSEVKSRKASSSAVARKALASAEASHLESQKHFDEWFRDSHHSDKAPQEGTMTNFWCYEVTPLLRESLEGIVNVGLGNAV